MLHVATNLVCFGLEDRWKAVYQSLKIDFLVRVLLKLTGALFRLTGVQCDQWRIELTHDSSWDLINNEMANHMLIKFTKASQSAL